jgi:hypothetical protein
MLLKQIARSNVNGGRNRALLGGIVLAVAIEREAMQSSGLSP